MDEQSLQHLEGEIFQIHARRAVEAVNRRIDAEAGLRLIDAHGAPVTFTQAGFDHFASPS